MKPTPIHVPGKVLDDLRRRLELTRWPDDLGNEDSAYGVNRALLQELVEHWRSGYDWRAAEAAMNAYDHYRVEVGGVPVHFMRKPGAGPSPTPLILLHGWPWTFWHWSKVVDSLAESDGDGEAFDVIVPSLPGFGFSSPLPRADLNYWKIADIFHELMTGVLGFGKYAVGGCDVGALIAGQLGHKHADSLHGIHIGSGQKLSMFNGERAWDITGGQPIPPGLPADAHARVLELERRFAVHLTAHVLEPSTLSFGLTDSPAGMLAWILQRWVKWSSPETVYRKDDLLTHATIYWVTNTIGTSIRTYANNNRYPWTPSHDRQPVVEAPTGLTLVNHENPPGVSTPGERVRNFVASERGGWYNLVNVRAHERGGHFIPWEIPAEWGADLRLTFRLARES
ncbi:epoxide hydrolase family protein [Amycolatopsis sp. ATCC 39116]|uniref:epoxide hydrolase family protein n=1 Tax=Amycolatopsis sp. (strain ATCC 39116 / 75iv2) TaxID=385957 RepID=UPI0002627231|nr:epoxide hydrolase [Amycolatopsis sp. ATCC 39116]